MAEIELRFNLEDLLNADIVAFSVWMFTCNVRLQEFWHTQDEITREHVCRLIGEPEDIKYCLKQLGLKNSSELIEEKE